MLALLLFSWLVTADSRIPCSPESLVNGQVLPELWQQDLPLGSGKLFGSLSTYWWRGHGMKAAIFWMHIATVIHCQ